MKLLNKEIKLSASVLSYYFILFGLMAMLPGYPILCGAFFVCLGIFQTFQASRENNDVLYTALLPVAKRDVVKAKYIFCVFIEGCGFALMLICTLIRMTLLKDAAAYRQNALMNANFVFLGFALLIFGCFNVIFVRGFFKTAYKFAKPFIAFIIVCFLIIGIAEALHYFPGCDVFNAFGFENMLVQLLSLCIGAVLYIILTFIGFKQSVELFEKIDL